MPADLTRTLNARDLAFITVGAIIGSGIFLVSGTVATQSGGSVGLSLTVWVIGGVLSFIGALAYGELACMDPRTGGLYVYLRDAFGPIVAFTYGWTLFVVILSGGVAALAVAASNVAEQLVPLGPWGRRVVALGMVAGLAAINVRGTRQSATVLSVATALKVAALVFLIVALPLAAKGFGSVQAGWPVTWSGSLLSGAGTAMISALWAYEGWQWSTMVAGEVVDPQRNFSRGIMVGTGVSVLIYILANAAYVAGLGAEDLARSVTPAADAVTKQFGSTGAKLIAIPILVSIVSGGHAISLSGSRVFYAMARDGVFFQKLGEVHPKFGTPAFSILAVSAWTAVLAMTGTFNILIQYVIFVAWIFYGLGALAVVVFRRTRPDAVRPFRVPGYPVTPILFLLSAVALVLNTVVTDPRKGVIGLGGVLLSVPIYFLWRRFRPAGAG